MPNTSRGLKWVSRPDGAGHWLLGNLRQPEWKEFRACVAFLKTSGLKHIAPALYDFLEAGNSASISVGLSSGGTSAEGLEELWRILEDFGQPLYIVHESRTAVSFHPKAYLFSSSVSARALVGSANMTEGGLFTNHELSASLDWDLTNEQDLEEFSGLCSVLDEWQTASPYCLELDEAGLQELFAAGLLPRESQIRPPRVAREVSDGQPTPRPALFGASTRVITPPVAAQPDVQTSHALHLPPIEPRAAAVPGPAGRQAPRDASAKLTAAKTGWTPSPGGARNVLVMEVRPHHNGEVFLSYRAVRDDNPGFLDYPFAGWTTPKQARNNPYPQMSPDPLVNITVYDAAGHASHGVADHSLNVVDYEPKREIRMTIPAHVVSHIPEMSVLVMTKDPGADLDFFLEFYPPGAVPPNIASAMTETLPSGGAGRGRRYGWL